MEEPQTDFFTGSKEAVEQYLQDRLLLLKLQVADKSSRLAALLFFGLIIALISFFILMFLSMMAGFYFATITGNLYMGFGIITALYVLIMLLLVIKRKWFAKRVIDAIIQVLFDKNDELDAKS